jgi:AraC-like DNA-binding protein
MTIFLLISNPYNKNKKSNYFFTFFLFCLFLIYLDECLWILGIEVENIIVQILFYYSPFFLISPAFYFSVKCYVSPGYKIQGRDILHIVPLFLSVILAGTVILLYIRKGSLANFVLVEDVLSLLILAMLIAQVLLYLLASYHEIKRYQKRLVLFSSSTGAINLGWLLNTIYGLIFLVVLWLLRLFIADLPFLLNAGYFFIVFYISYSAINQQEIVTLTEKESLDLIQAIESSDGILLYFKSYENFSAEKERLVHLMEQTKPYLDNELSLPKLADLFQTNTHQLSYLINKGFNENFNDFVNRYRVEESKRLLKDTNLIHLNMVGIALEAGFNSKTAFNSAFKKFTGYTPTAFRKVKS